MGTLRAAARVLAMTQTRTIGLQGGAARVLAMTHPSTVAPGVAAFSTTRHQLAGQAKIRKTTSDAKLAFWLTVAFLLGSWILSRLNHLRKHYYPYPCIMEEHYEYTQRLKREAAAAAAQQQWWRTKNFTNVLFWSASMEKTPFVGSLQRQSIAKLMKDRNIDFFSYPNWDVTKLSFALQSFNEESGLILHIVAGFLVSSYLAYVNW